MAIELNRKDLSKTDLLEIQKNLTITVRSTNGRSESKDFIFDFDKNSIRVPFAYLGKKSVPFKNVANGFVGELRDQQKDIATRALDFLAETGSVVISAFTGAGKTVTSLYIAAVLGKKTLILTNRKMLIDQWEASVNKFCPLATVDKLVPNRTVINPDASFVIANPLNIPKFPREFFSDIQVLIVDELHQLVSPKILRSFFWILPQFVIGLSATPLRYDSYDKCIPMFFGTNHVNVPLMKFHRVYSIKTGYVPPIVSTPQGLDWNAVLDGQAKNFDRNKLICEVLEKLHSRHWLVLVKRIVHAENLAGLLRLRGIPCELLTGDKTLYDRNCRILIGTVSKVGVGFDNPNIDALFVAADVKAYFIQSLGRCMRRPDVKPIIVDLLDSFNPLVKHFKERLKVYKDHGGTVKELKFNIE